jgi:hypothetical protein
VSCGTRPDPQDTVLDRNELGVIPIAAGSSRPESTKAQSIGAVVNAQPAWQSDD